MGLGLREVAADVVCTLGMEEDEGKIDALREGIVQLRDRYCVLPPKRGHTSDFQR